MSLSASVIVGGRRKACAAAMRVAAAPSCAKRMLVMTMGQMPSYYGKKCTMVDGCDGVVLVAMFRPAEGRID